MDLASLTAQLSTLRESALKTVAEAADLDALGEAENAVLGRKQGQLTAILRGIGSLPGADRPRIGALANDVRATLEAAIAERREQLQASALQQRLAAERIDPTLPGRPFRTGSLHPIAETGREIGRIFQQFGFVTYESPEVETEYLNFQALNIPADHPARDLWDTIYVDGPATGDERLLLRTHTSPGQIRIMREGPPPIRALLPGRCFRYEAVDASHGFEFFQVEGLMVDEGVSFGHLKGVLHRTLTY